MTMRRVFLLMAAVLVAVAAYYWWPRHMGPRPAPDVVEAVGGNITTVPIAHATLQIEQGPHVIRVDPTASAAFDGVSGILRLNYEGLTPPTIVLVTHDHPDHYDAGLL